MIIQELFKISSKNIRRRKLRSWLTMLGIIISIATIFVLIAVSLGLSAAVQEQFRQLGTDKFFIMPKGQLGGPGTSGAVKLTSDDVNVIKKISGVKDYFYASGSPVEVGYSDQKRYANAFGAPLDHIKLFFETGFIVADEGRIIAQGDTKQIAVGSLYKSGNIFRQPVHAGDTVTLNGVKFKVKTVLKSVGNPSDDKQIYMSLDDFENLFPEKKNNYAEIIVQADPGVDIKTLAAKVEKQLINSRGVTKKTEDFTILTPEELLATFGTILNILTGFLLGIAAISLLVGGIGITNTMYTAVLERTKEIGVMKAVGARNSDILTIFTIESGLLGLIGGAGGIILGYLAGKAIEFVAVTAFQTNLLRISTPWYLIVGCLGFSFAIGAVSGLWPAYNASKIKPVIALRYE